MIEQPMFDLLDDAIFRVCLKNGSLRDCSLSEVFELLVRDEIVSFERLQPYQGPPWHAFLVQVAALSLHLDPKDPQQVSAAEWKARLLHLSGEDRDAWCLVVPDVTRPAFMQPPMMSKEHIKGLKETEEWGPCAYDVLVSGRNHDNKRSRIFRPDPEHWVHALVTLQTTQGYSGSGKYGCVRMNGGYGSRCFVGLDHGFSLGARFVRDIEILLKERDAIVSDFGYRAKGGHALLWLQPWDGRSPLALSELDPFFIEVCRRVRLVRKEDRLIALDGTSECERIQGKERKGDLGDPWIPIEREEGQALSVARDGWTSEILVELIAGTTYEAPAAQRVGLASRSEPTWLLCEVLARGQGKTDGWHQRWVPLPPKVRSLLETEDGRQQVHRLAQERLKVVKEMSKVLSQSLKVLTRGSSSWTRYWERAFEREMDAAFFDSLWEAIEAELTPEENQRVWIGMTNETAKHLFSEATRVVPISSVERYRRIAEAEIRFYSAAKHRFPEAFEKSQEVKDESERAFSPHE